MLPTGPNHRFKRLTTYWILVLPALIWFLAFFLFPLTDVLRTSLNEWQSILRPRKFIGLENYRRMLRDPVFFLVLKNSILRVFINFCLMMPVALVLGHMISLKPAGARFFRVLFFFPFLLSAIASALIWWLIFLPDGVLNSFLETVGRAGLQRAWIANSRTAFTATVVPMVWTAIGFYAVLFFSVLQDIPASLFEAAEIDGLSAMGCFLKIRLPLSLPFMGVYFIWELIGGFNNFGSIVVLTRGGPGNSSSILGYYAFEEAFRYRHLGYASALSVVTFVVCMLLALVIQKAVARDYEY